ncbi:3-hydroxyacyl-[acyl-carrier-protein] dehydratase [Paraburkholderia kururiensis]|uniref:hypothetical protein n=1 Tax=Paraburkholderia kururiensis TaxID=984307 RepID=UPI0039A6FEDD
MSFSSSDNDKQPEHHTTFTVSGTDVFALGHYPDNPVYPGVLTADALCAAAAALASRILGTAAVPARIEKVHYLHAIVPGDVVAVSAKLVAISGNEVQLEAVAAVAAIPAARALVVCSGGLLPVAPLSRQLPSGCDGLRRIEHRSLLSVLPHRYPFLMLDVVDGYVPGKRIVAHKIATSSALWPSTTARHTYPLAFVIESLAQAAVALFLLSGVQGQFHDILMGALSEVCLLADVPLGSMLIIEVRMGRQIGSLSSFDGEVRVGARTIVTVGCVYIDIRERTMQNA